MRMVCSIDSYVIVSYVNEYCILGVLDSNAGVTHMMEHLAFKSTKTRSHAELVRYEITCAEVNGIHIGAHELYICIEILKILGL